METASSELFENLFTAHQKTKYSTLNSAQLYTQHNKQHSKHFTNTLQLGLVCRLDPKIRADYAYSLKGGCPDSIHILHITAYG